MKLFLELLALFIDLLVGFLVGIGLTFLVTPANAELGGVIYLALFVPSCVLLYVIIRRIFPRYSFGRWLFKENID